MVQAGGMTVEAAQAEVRTVYLSGSVGQMVSGVIWLISAALSTWGSRQMGAATLIFGGAFIFPLTQATLIAFGRRASLSASNPLRFLAGHFDGTNVTGILNADSIGALVDPVPASIDIGRGVNATSHFWELANAPE